MHAIFLGTKKFIDDLAKKNFYQLYIPAPIPPKRSILGIILNARARKLFIGILIRLNLLILVLEKDH